ncbi:MAG: hypothetical protein Q9P14_06495 [candidate division KSB1 bacterium]|nr:hypothetical protein [candidate division KSB1 bacterium]
MNEQALREDVANQIFQKREAVQNLPALMGFDGFVDEIVRLVDKKQNRDQYTFIPTISAFAERLSRAAGKSANVEMRVDTIKLGGNGPIMANAMLQFGLRVTYIGNLGYPDLHPVFRDFASRARVCTASPNPAIPTRWNFPMAKSCWANIRLWTRSITRASSRVWAPMSSAACGTKAGFMPW